MSLSLIIASTNGIVVQLTRRVGSYIHPVLVDAEKYRLLCGELATVQRLSWSEAASPSAIYTEVMCLEEAEHFSW